MSGDLLMAMLMQLTTYCSNIDRYLAIFQALREDLWFDNPDQPFTVAQGRGTWSLREGDVETPKTALAPFHVDENANYHTSDSVKHTFDLGYTYPELQPWDPRNQVNGQFSSEKYKANINQQLTQLYDTVTNWALRTSSKTVKHGVVKSVAGLAQKILPERILSQAAAPSGHAAATNGDATEDPHKSSNDEKAVHDDYVVNVLYDK